jgi:hypothetical protein
MAGRLGSGGAARWTVAGAGRAAILGAGPGASGIAHQKVRGAGWVAEVPAALRAPIAVRVAIRGPADRSVVGTSAARRGDVVTARPSGPKATETVPSRSVR